MSVWQFSIWGLLSGTTAVAIALGTAKKIELSFGEAFEAVTFFGCFALTGLVVLLLALGIKSTKLAPWLTLLVASVVCPLAGMFVGVTVLPQRERPVDWALFGFSFGATIALAVLALRVAGYRLSRAPLDPADLEGTDADELDVKAAKMRGVEEGGVKIELDERDVASIDALSATKQPIKIHVPEQPDVALPDVALPDVAPPDIAESRPSLSIRTDFEDE